MSPAATSSDNTWSEAARRLLAARYLRRDERGVVIETIDELFWRVARAIAEADAAFPRGNVAATAERFHDVMVKRQFLPNTPALINAGTELGQLMACFVLPVPDSLHGIFTALHDAAIIQQSGGGTGFTFTHLRPAGDLVQSTRRPSSGPVPFIRIFDTMSDVIKGESVRGGANMGVLRVDHPDIRTFISAKRQPGVFTHFNLSVATPNRFMTAARRDQSFSLINPRTGKVAGRVRASALLDEIAENAWATGDPGMIFLDRIERDNPTPTLGPLEATNPCGEVPLLPYEACVLGSVNLSAFVQTVNERAHINEEALCDTVRLAVHFLDNIVEASRYPLPQIEAACRANRKIGVGVMGLADALIALGIPYGSRASLRVTGRLMRLVQTAAVEATRALATIRGAFPNFPISRFAAAGEPPRRNATVTTVAPTGSISLIAGCSSGIEPLYALAYERHGEFVQVMGPHPALLSTLERIGRLEPELLADIEATGRIGHRTDLPEEVRRLFRTALEIPPEEHLAIQAVVQRHVENAVSKTINLPATATVEDVRHAYERAYELDCKGVTVFREGASAGQVLQILGHCLVCTSEDVIPREGSAHPAAPSEGETVAL